MSSPVARVSSVYRADSNRNDPDDPQDDREEIEAIATSAARVAPSRDRTAVKSEVETRSWPLAASEDWQPLVSLGTRLDPNHVVTDRMVEGSNFPPATMAALSAALEDRPPVAATFTLPSSVQPVLPAVEVSRVASGPVAAPTDESPAPPGAAAPETPEGDPGEGPAPRGAGPIAVVLPFDGPALDRAVDRFFAHLEDLDVRQPATLLRVSSILAVLAAAVALEVARRWYRSRNDPSAPGNLLTCGFPEWPGTWPVSPR